MERKKVVLGVVGGLGLTALLATSVSTWCLLSKVRRLEAECADATRASRLQAEDEASQGGTGPADATGGDNATRASRLQAEGEASREGTVPAEKEPEPLAITRFSYSGGDEIILEMNGKPDLDVARQYVTVEPLREGALSFGYRRRWDWDKNARVPQFVISGDFAYRTNLTLTVRKGFPLEGQLATTNGVDLALAADYVKTFKRNDALHSVGFADKGRYLAPSGRRAVALTSCNVKELEVLIAPVPSANIVTMLALEENEFNHIWKEGCSGENEYFMKDLSGSACYKRITTPNRPNEKETVYVTLDSTGVEPPEKGKPAVVLPEKGVFFVKADTVKEAALTECRVICLTDLGISARRMPDGISVWVTSLSQGVPVEGAIVEVYSSGNECVAKGVSDATGRCTCTTLTPGVPFAVVVSAPDGSDRSFLALSDRMALAEEDPSEFDREAFLEGNDATAFVWTERGIYRHGEKVFLQAILRGATGVAPKPFPVELKLIDPLDNVRRTWTQLPDEAGSLIDESIVIGEDLPSGTWKIVLNTPGKNGKRLGSREIKVEEFAPPQIRVKSQAKRGVKPQDFTFDVNAEHLYGGPAKSLACSGAIVFEDVAFTPPAWRGWSFGNEDRGLKPNFRELEKNRLDESGRCSFDAPLLADTGKPKAAVRITAQGTVFEDGGRPASARDSVIGHYYPYYIGTTLRDWVRLPQVGRPEIEIACVNPDATRVNTPKKLFAKLECVESIYSYRRNDEGWTTWDCERVRRTVAEKLPIETKADGNVTFEIPTETCGDYVLTIEEEGSDVSFAKAFYLSDWGDDQVRAPLSNPTAVTLKADKSFYRPGEVPRLVVKSPFAGTALLTVMRNEVVYTEVLALTNATSEILLKPCEADWAPNVEARLTVVQKVAPGQKRLAARAHGTTTIVVRRSEDELPVTVAAVPTLAQNDAGSAVKVDVTAPGAQQIVVTLVDEGINLLTGEPMPDPIAYFAKPRCCGWSIAGFFDLYHRLLPAYGDDQLKASGIKTGGGFGADMLGRVSPTPTRRFKPLALWQKNVPVTDGKASVTFTLPEFVGEVRVTAVAWSDRASGSAAVQQKICPKVVMEPDAPRFVAPGDRFRVSLPLANRAEEAGEIAYRITDENNRPYAEGKVHLAAGDSTVVHREVTAMDHPGQMRLCYEATGFGERHAKTIELPVRPAVPWQETCGVERLEPGATFKTAEAESGQFFYSVATSQAGSLCRALEWLADYPHGCLEQTSSRILPLVTAGGFLNDYGSVKTADLPDYVRAGVARVESMVRAHDFTMWPDCNYAPWDREVSLYASHFLFEAKQAGYALNSRTSDRVLSFLDKWALSSKTVESAYACHTLALAGRPNRDRMLRLYDDRDKLDLLSRARLARAFVATADRKRAEALLKTVDSPSSVREAAFATLALLELDPEDKRLPGLVTYLLKNRSDANLSWGTTGENAHALMALAAYYRAHPVAPGRPDVRHEKDVLINKGEAPAFVTWRSLTLPKVEELKDESNQLAIKRTYLSATGEPYDLAKAACGDLVFVRITLTSDLSRDYSDLVIEDLLPGAFEPVHAPLKPANGAIGGTDSTRWVMRSDLRDDRTLVFSKKFHLEKDEEVEFVYPVRVVSPGTYTLPGVAVDAMYQPSVRARTRADRLVVHD